MACNRISRDPARLELHYAYARGPIELDYRHGHGSRTNASHFSFLTSSDTTVARFRRGHNEQITKPTA